MSSDLDASKQFNLFKINTATEKTSPLSGDYSKLSTGDSVFFDVTDIIDNKILLWDNTFRYHILGEDGAHEDRSYLNTEYNIEQIKNGLTNPLFILKDKSREDRFQYVSLPALDYNGEQKIRKLDIITEPSKIVIGYHEIVTVIPKSSVNDKIEGRIIYNAYDKNKRK